MTEEEVGKTADGVGLAVARQDPELQRAVFEHMGWNHILENVGMTVLDDGEDERSGILVEARGRIAKGTPWPFEERRFLRRRTKAGVWTATPVPNRIASVRDARAWLDAGARDDAGEPTAA